MPEPKLDRRRLERPDKEDVGAYCPPVDVIAAECAAIIDSLPEHVRRKRMGANAPPAVELLVTDTSMMTGRDRGR